MTLLWTTALFALIGVSVFAYVHMEHARYNLVVANAESCLTAYVHTMGHYDLSKVNKAMLLHAIDRLACKRHYASDGVRRAFEEVRCVPPMHDVVVKEWIGYCDSNPTLTRDRFQHAVDALAGVYMASGFTHDFAALKAAVSIYHGYWEDAE